MSRFLTLTLALALAPLPALASTDGGAGAVGQISEYTNTAESGGRAGWVYIGSEYYYWGGDNCSGVRPPSEAQIARLFTARIEGIMVNPWYKTPVSADVKCLTIFMTY